MIKLYPWINFCQNRESDIARVLAIPTLTLLLVYPFQWFLSFTILVLECHRASGGTNWTYTQWAWITHDRVPTFRLSIHVFRYSRSWSLATIVPWPLSHHVYHYEDAGSNYTNHCTNSHRVSCGPFRLFRSPPLTTLLLSFHHMSIFGNSFITLSNK